jgi:hypothetical protein
MKPSQRLSKTVIFVCLLIMQAQLWASVTLGCRHEVGSADSSQAACPFHTQSISKPSQGHPARLLDCQKCVLHLAVGAPALAAGAPALPPLLGRSAPPVLAERHFYRFTPESIHRPPIA